MPSHIAKLLTCFVQPFQSLESAYQQLLVDRNVYTAVGAQQDIIGDIVGQPRNGQDDATYQRFLLARIAANRSKGTYEDLITVTRLVLNDNPDPNQVLIWNEGTATVRVFPQAAIDDDLALILFGFLRQAAVAGVNLVLEWSNVAIASDFRFDSGPGFDVGHLAWSVN